MVKSWEFYVAMAIDIEAAADNGTTAEKMMSALKGSYFLRETRQYAEDAGAPWPPSAEWARLNIQTGGE